MLVTEIIGNLGSDAEIKDFSGKKFVSFNVAHTDSHVGADGVKSTTAVWVSVLWFGEGGNIMPYLKTGTKLFVRGRLYTKLYTDKSGASQIALNINASEVILCGSK